MSRLRLAGGRTLAFDDPDDRGGAPIVLFHGAPGSRRFRPAMVPGVRVVTFDRPGYGGSDPSPGRRLHDCARDVSELADHLGLDRFGAVGWSGGGPFATAVAHELGERVTCLAVVSAPGPLDEVPGAWEALGAYRLPTAEMARQDPERSVRAIARHMAPFVADPPAFLGSGRGPDGAVLRGPGRAMLVEQVHEALRQGAAGIAADLVAMWVDWGFRLADVAVPTHVWHGARDPHNGSDTQAYAARIAGALRTVWPDHAHLGVVAHWPEIARWTAGITVPAG